MTHTHPDEHPHPHGAHDDGGQGVLARLRHLVTPHSHDSGDRFDSALEASRLGMRTLVWSFVALLATGVL